MGIYMIPVDSTDVNMIYDNLLDSYRLISLEHVSNFKASYITTHRIWQCSTSAL
jgi:hypothetical protein